MRESFELWRATFARGVGVLGATVSRVGGANRPCQRDRGHYDGSTGMDPGLRDRPKGFAP